MPKFTDKIANKLGDEHPVSRHLKGRKWGELLTSLLFSLFVLALLGVWAAATAGYETASKMSPDWNMTDNDHWFAKFTPPRKPPLCQPAFINTGSSFYTTNGIFLWQMGKGFNVSAEKAYGNNDTEVNFNSTLQEYSDYTLSHCDVSGLSIDMDLRGAEVDVQIYATCIDPKWPALLKSNVKFSVNTIAGQDTSLWYSDVIQPETKESNDIVSPIQDLANDMWKRQRAMYLNTTNNAYPLVRGFRIRNLNNCAFDTQDKKTCFEKPLTWSNDTDGFYMYPNLTITTSDYEPVVWNVTTNNLVQAVIAAARYDFGANMTNNLFSNNTVKQQVIATQDSTGLRNVTNATYPMNALTGAQTFINIPEFMPAEVARVRTSYLCMVMRMKKPADFVVSVLGLMFALFGVVFTALAFLFHKVTGRTVGGGPALIGAPAPHDIVAEGEEEQAMMDKDGNPNGPHDGGEGGKGGGAGVMRQNSQADTLAFNSGNKHNSYGNLSQLTGGSGGGARGGSGINLSDMAGKAGGGGSMLALAGGLAGGMLAGKAAGGSPGGSSLNLQGLASKAGGGGSGLSLSGLASRASGVDLQNLGNNLPAGGLQAAKGTAGSGFNLNTPPMSRLSSFASQYNPFNKGNAAAAGVGGAAAGLAAGGAAAAYKHHSGASGDTTSENGGLTAVNSEIGSTSQLLGTYNVSDRGSSTNISNPYLASPGGSQIPLSASNPNMPTIPDDQPPIAGFVPTTGDDATPRPSVDPHAGIGAGTAAAAGALGGVGAGIAANNATGQYFNASPELLGQSQMPAQGQYPAVPQMPAAPAAAAQVPGQAAQQFGNNEFIQPGQRVSQPTISPQTQMRQLDPTSVTMPAVDAQAPIQPPAPTAGGLQAPAPSAIPNRYSGLVPGAAGAVLGGTAAAAAIAAGARMSASPIVSPELSEPPQLPPVQKINLNTPETAAMGTMPNVPQPNVENPQGMAGLTGQNFAQNLPQNVREMPQNLQQGLPQNLQNMPQDLQNVPQHLQQNMPQNLQDGQGMASNVPQQLQNFPQGAQDFAQQNLQNVPGNFASNVPQNLQNIPRDMTSNIPQNLQGAAQGIPQNLQNVPQNLQNFPHAAQDFAQQNIQNVPGNLASNVPQNFQNIPQNIPQGSHNIGQTVAAGLGGLGLGAGAAGLAHFALRSSAPQGHDDLQTASTASDSPPRPIDPTRSAQRSIPPPIDPATGAVQRGLDSPEMPHPSATSPRSIPTPDVPVAPVPVMSSDVPDASRGMPSASECAAQPPASGSAAPSVLGSDQTTPTGPTPAATPGVNDRSEPNMAAVGAPPAAPFASNARPMSAFSTDSVYSTKTSPGPRTSMMLPDIPEPENVPAVPSLPPHLAALGKLPESFSQNSSSALPVTAAAGAAGAGAVGLAAFAQRYAGTSEESPDMTQEPSPPVSMDNMRFPTPPNAPVQPPSQTRDVDAPVAGLPTQGPAPDAAVSGLPTVSSMSSTAASRTSAGPPMRRPSPPDISVPKPFAVMGIPTSPGAPKASHTSAGPPAGYAVQATEPRTPDTPTHAESDSLLNKGDTHAF